MGSTFRVLMIIFSLNLLIGSVVWGTTTTAGLEAFNTKLAAEETELEAKKKIDVEAGQETLFERFISGTKEFISDVVDAAKLAAKLIGLFWKAFFGWPEIQGTTVDILIINIALKTFRIGLYIWAATEAFMFYVNKKTS